MSIFFKLAGRVLPAKGKFDIIDIARIGPDADINSRRQATKMFDPGGYFGAGCDDYQGHIQHFLFYNLSSGFSRQPLKSAAGRWLLAAGGWFVRQLRCLPFV
jgi:hypothetical protein